MLAHDCTSSLPRDTRARLRTRAPRGHGHAGALGVRTLVCEGQASQGAGRPVARDGEGGAGNGVPGGGVGDADAREGVGRHACLAGAADRRGDAEGAREVRGSGRQHALRLLFARPAAGGPIAAIERTFSRLRTHISLQSLQREGPSTDGLGRPRLGRQRAGRVAEVREELVPRRARLLRQRVGDGADRLRVELIHGDRNRRARHRFVKRLVAHLQLPSRRARLSARPRRRTRLSARPLRRGGAGALAKALRMLPTAWAENSAP
jgi:hypothetical protein